VDGVGIDGKSVGYMWSETCSGMPRDFSHTVLGSRSGVVDGTQEQGWI
jgi:hypothetical protein